jgi:hypothetical protein
VIVEERTYTLYPGKMAEYMRIYAEHGVAIQTRVLGNLIGYFSSEIGELNNVVSLWGYESMEARTRLRAQLQDDEGWRAYVPKILPLIQTMQNRILIPASFSPIR